jgi:hypothetical protein
LDGKGSLVNPPLEDRRTKIQVSHHFDGRQRIQIGHNSLIL